MKIKSLFLSLFGIASALAQQDAQFTQYMYNQQLFNPSYIGSTESLRGVAIHRNQWVGLKGAPVTNSFSISNSFGKKVALGLSINDDRIGPSKESSVGLDFSYTIDLNDNYKLSLGLKASANLLNVDYTLLDIYQEDDPDFANNIVNRFSPNIGVGFFTYNQNSYLGFSIPNLLETKHLPEYRSSLAKEAIHYYLTGGYVFDLNSSLKFKPAFLIKHTQNTPFAIDISSNFLINDKFTLGAAYRLSETFSFLTGFQVTDKWMIGYSYDLEAGTLSSYNSGSHEFFLKFDLGEAPNKKLLTPRFF